jgi:hypothetical protein
MIIDPSSETLYQLEIESNCEFQQQTCRDLNFFLKNKNLLKERGASNGADLRGGENFSAPSLPYERDCAPLQK